MILNIIGKEIRYQLKNVTFYGFFIVVLLMFFSQLGTPTKGDLIFTTQKENFYNYQNITDKDKQMEQMYFWLGKDYAEGTAFKYKFSLITPAISSITLLRSESKSRFALLVQKDCTQLLG